MWREAEETYILPSSTYMIMFIGDGLDGVLSLRGGLGVMLKRSRSSAE